MFISNKLNIIMRLILLVLIDIFSFLVFQSTLHSPFPLSISLLGLVFFIGCISFSVIDGKILIGQYKDISTEKKN